MPSRTILKKIVENQVPLGKFFKSIKRLLRKLRMNIESESTGAVEKILAKLRVLLQDEVMLDISALE